MNPSPSRLYEICLNFLCSNLDLVCESSSQQASISSSKSFNNSKKIEFRNKHVKFNHIISEDLLERLCDLGKLNDASIHLFTNKQTCLKNLTMKNVSLSKDSIKTLLKQHQINELTLNNIDFKSIDMDYSNSTPSLHHLANSNFINVNDLIENLNEWSLEHLRYLNLSRNISFFGSILTNLKQLTNLTKLNVSFTYFNNHSLDIITHDLINLEFLDISGTRVSDLQSLLRLKHKLRYLYMYNMRASLTDDIISVICCMSKLERLDLSCDVSTKIFSDMTLSLFDVNLLLDQLTFNKLNDLKYLDISGKSNINQEILLNFVNCYSNLKFIGLALTNANSFDIFRNSPQNIQKPSIYEPSKLFSEIERKADLIITGESNESQLIASLKHYKTRHTYIQKALFNLFLLTKNFQETRVDVLQLIVELMRVHGKSQSVQLAATTCIYNLTKRNLFSKVPKPILTKVISSVLETMQNFPNTLILQKNCLLIFDNEQMLKSCIFDKYNCVKVTLDFLSMNNDAAIINSAINVCAQVAFNAEPKYRQSFGKLADPKYAKKLIHLVDLSIASLVNDSKLYFLLDIITTFSENSAEWSSNFITQDCVNICCNLIELFESDQIVLSKVMHLLYNFSELEQIRPIIFRNFLVEKIKNLLDHTETKIKFLAVGVFANFIAYLPESKWDWNSTILKSTTKREFYKKLENIIDNWNLDVISENLLNKHRLNSFFNLIKLNNDPIVQMWSLWAILNVYQSNYNEMEEKNECIDLINSIRSNKKTWDKVKELCNFVLNFFS